MRYAIVAALVLWSGAALAQKSSTPAEVGLEAAFTALQANLQMYASEQKNKLDAAAKHAADVDAWWRAYVGGPK